MHSWLVRCPSSSWRWPVPHCPTCRPSLWGTLGAVSIPLSVWSSASPGQLCTLLWQGAQFLQHATHTISVAWDPRWGTHESLWLPAHLSSPFTFNCHPRPHLTAYLTKLNELQAQEWRQPACKEFEISFWYCLWPVSKELLDLPPLILILLPNLNLWDAMRNNSYGAFFLKKPNQEPRTRGLPRETSMVTWGAFHDASPSPRKPQLAPFE